MVEEENVGVKRGQSTEFSALGIAMEAAARDETVAREAREFLREQTEVLRLQKAALKEEALLNLSHLRFRRFSDHARVGLELAGFLVVLLIVCGLGSMVWSATQDRDLVVDAFSVPADVAQSGMTGSVLAGRILDRLGQMQASTYSLAQGAGAFHSNDTEQVRIEIPSTGISIGELNRYLREWLGHETHVAGDLVRTVKGFALTIRYGDQPGNTVEGGDLIKLIDPASERLYRAGRPLRYADYLAERGRYGEAEAIVVPLAGSGSVRDRALAYVSWGTLLFRERNPYGEEEKSLLAVQLDPANAAAWFQVDAGAYNAGNGEEALRAEKTVLSLIKAGKADDLNPDLATTLLTALSADLAIDTGDPAGAIVQCRNAVGRPDALDCGNVFMVGYEADDHDIAEARRYAALIPPKESNIDRQSAAPDLAQASIATEEKDWPGVIRWERKAVQIFQTYAIQPADLHIRVLPELASAMARSGDCAGAQAIISRTPVACDSCLRARAQIAAAKRDWAASGYWFSRYSARTPSMPYADTFWGAMLLAKGDFDGAIAKFKLANQKGPHFADPLEMWGEALMLKNRSDLALAKFVEANKYAPNWGRLHFEWGKALFYARRKDEARKQFAMASHLDLSAADRAGLARVNAHG